VPDRAWSSGSGCSTGRRRARRSRAARSPRAPPEPSARARVADRASELFCEHVLQDVLVEAQIGNVLLEREGDLLLGEPAHLLGSAPPIRVSHNRKTRTHAAPRRWGGRPPRSPPRPQGWDYWRR
jgi:hypothetical protein